VTEEKRETAARKLVVIDGANAIYRAFFAIPNLRAPDGSPTNALHGFVNMLIKVIREEAADWVAVAFDPRGGTFRNRIFDGYKATRDAQPEDLSAQIPVMRELLEAFKIPLVVVDDFEADDVIATLVAQVPDDMHVTIVSTDKDLMQLVSDRVVLLDTGKDRRVGPAEVQERFGVPPEKMLDLRALVGDPSDNIPGVKGIGAKGAAKLIDEWGDLETLLDNAAQVKAKRAREALLEQREQAELSKELSTLRSDVPLPLPLERLARQAPDVERLRELYQRLGFTRLLAGLDGGDAASSAPGEGGGEAAVEVELECVADAAALGKLLSSLDDSEPLALQLVLEAGSAVDARLVGLGLALEDARAAFVPITGDDRVAEAGVTVEQLADALRILWPEAGSGRAWYGTETKEAQSALAELGVEPPLPEDDVQIAAFLLDPAGHHQIPALASAQLGRELPAWEDVAGRGAKAVPAGQLPTEKLAEYAGQRVCALRALRPALREKLESDGLVALYADVELPLTRVLSQMERAGVRIDEAKLEELAIEYGGKLAVLEQEIYALAGEEFLIGSPKQLQVILFEKLKLPPLKKTKTGYSTAEGVLEQLRAHHELPGKILDYRKLAKLMSTYIDALPPLVCERTGRIHPRFNQLGAATGRLSASHPNVQNIPIRGAEGARIREAFVPAEGRVLLSADYSQVELRVLAHYSGDESLIDAFRKGEDIHRLTAAEVAGIGLDEVDAELRARAKAVNFGIIYGSSAFGLANQLGIATGEAQQTIDAYFARYEGVRRFLDETMADAKETGFVQTLLGRRRYLPDIQSRNRVLRQAAERMAVNTVIQGTAADLIKKAMVAVQEAILGSELDATMILQVHDELVFELAPRDVDALTEQVRECMVGALELDVPLVVDVGTGESWRTAH
jgi:DNA polymerase-1